MGVPCPCVGAVATIHRDGGKWARRGLGSAIQGVRNCAQRGPHTRERGAKVSKDGEA